MAQSFMLILLLVGKSQCFRRTVLAMAPKDGTQLAVMVYKNGHPELISTVNTGPISPFASTHQTYEKHFVMLLLNIRLIWCIFIT